VKSKILDFYHLGRSMVVRSNLVHKAETLDQMKTYSLLLTPRKHY
jgi:hypothetical protein